MATTSLADAKRRLSEIVSSAQRTHERTVVTKNGRPAAVIMSVEDLESLEETLFWLAEPGTCETLAEADRGELVSDEDIKRTWDHHRMPILLDTVVDTDYGQFDLIWGDGGGFDGDFDTYFAGQVNGLVGASGPDGVYLNLARRSGGSAVRISLRDSMAPPPSMNWEDVVEVSIEVPDGVEVGWSSWAGESGDTLALPPGSYRLRVSAEGRDRGAANEFADEVVDRYLLELWPSPAAPDVIVRCGSADARHWHDQLRDRSSGSASHT